MVKISDDTRVVLLLTAPLLISSEVVSWEKVLSVREYNFLVEFLGFRGWRPCDLLGSSSNVILAELPDNLDRDRLSRLLERDSLLCMVLAEWERRGIWVVSCEDVSYPERLRSRLGRFFPLVLYGCGNMGLLKEGGLAVVGSCKVGGDAVGYAKDIGKFAAESEVLVVVRGIRGVGGSVMDGALEGNGQVVSVVTESLAEIVLNFGVRKGLMSEGLALVSVCDPFLDYDINVEKDRFIYGLADMGLVISSDLNMGNTWIGASEQLAKLNFVPMFVFDRAGFGPGNKPLIRCGGRVWPEVSNCDEFLAVLTGEVGERLVEGME